MGKNKAHNRKKKRRFFEKSETPISQIKEILGYKPPQNLYFIHYFYCFSVLSTYHIPTGFGFSPKASGFYPFGDATDLAGEGGVGDVVWMIQASA